ncbi:hypothetical protein DPMN_029265 [Dreissena polymorpha]|uniref:Uncharacterized protein n=1 Tax=Dreissena polymorpha TaxID=45954 RepID=A0A9D4RGY9_DREPO|nr:hypothetical protein DPMN_029265 [Dreissena polymorpha]
MFKPTFMISEHPGGNVFQQTEYIFVHIQNIIKTNILTKFHEDWKKQKIKNAPPPGSHVFQQTGTIFQLAQDIIGTILLTRFHENQTINVASRVLTRKNAPLHWCPCFSTNHIIVTNLLTKFQDGRTINVASRALTRKNAPPPGVHVFQPTRTIFKIVQDISRMNLLTKFHEDRTINVASRVLLKPYIAIQGKMPRPWCPCFSSNRNHFQPVQDITRTNLLTKFHGDRTINVAS